MVSRSADASYNGAAQKGGRLGLTRTRWMLFAIVVALVVAFFVFGLGEYLTLSALQSGRGRLVAIVEGDPITSSVAFFAFYVAVTALSLPGAAVMTLAAGAIFGLWWGLVLVSFASSVGATFAFLLSRTLLRSWVQSRFGARLGTINDGFERDGAFYLFGLRMVPVVPFFVVNLLMGLTSIGIATFYWVSQVGMLAATFVYVFAGTQLAGVTALGDIMSPGLIVALSLLGLFPLAARRLLMLISVRRENDEMG